MNPLIQAGPSLRERDGKPQSLSYLLAVILIVGALAFAAVVTGLIPPAQARLPGNRTSASIAPSAAPNAACAAVPNGEKEEKPCAG